MFSYLAYGLGLHSTLPLPEFLPAEAGCDVLIQVEEGIPLPADTPVEQSYLKVTAEEACLYFRGVGVFVVRGGRQITVRPLPGVEAQALRLYLVGTVMAILLYQRGLLVLHASTVEVEGGAVAFLGESGWGKSSLAAALHCRGHGVIADDVTAVRLSPAEVFPAFPQFKLSLEAADVLGYDRGSLLVLHPAEEKRAYRSPGEFSSAPLPLRRLYVLSWGALCELEPLGPQEAVIELVRNSYPTRFLCPAGALHFLQCTRLVREVPVHRLKRPRSLPGLPALASLIEEDLAGALALG